MLSAVAALGLLASPLAATPTGDANSTQATSGKQSSAKPKKVCKQIANTGTRIGKRMCKTQEQWDAEEAEAANNVKDRASGRT